MSVLMQIVGSLLSLAVQISLWKALYANGNEPDTLLGSVSLNEMYAYSVISIAISIFVGNSVIHRMDSKIKTGEIAVDLMKPLNLHFIIISETIGNNLFLAIVQLLPIALVGVMLFDINIPSWTYMLLFMIALVNAFVLNFIISYIFGMIGFWYLSIWQINIIMDGIVRILSGRWIPLWLFPPFLAAVSAFFPYRFIYYEPITIFLGKATVMDSVRIIGLQLIWIAGLFAVATLVWNKGVRKLVIQGG
jgi:ABC-2 type transport system permease protein